jgi:SAM-dependent methyltransferase
MAVKEEWFKDTVFWERYAPIIFDEKRWAEVPEVADGITRLARLDLYHAESSAAGSAVSLPGPRILDFCCGFGRITLELARRGFAASGVDITESYLRTAREEAAYEKLDVEFIHSDVRSFKRPGFFDAAVNLYISFGYFEDPAEDLLMLRNVHESLKPGGSLIIETLGKEIAVRDFTKAEWFERAGYFVLTEYAPADSWGSLVNRWILVKQDPGEGKAEGERIEKTLTQRLYAATELRALLREGGFASVDIYGGWDESPYDDRASALIAVARKGT